jgi:hypothetical protein
MPAFKDLTGRRFNRWTVLSCAGRSRGKSGNLIWLCRCDCGTIREVAGNNLPNGASKSCGCHNEEARRSRITHGLTRRGKPKPLEYSSWSSMIQRCTKPTNTKWHNYGGRGIRVCDRWRNSFEAFLEGMGPRPSPSHSIDRIDNDSNYEPGNCRWATPKEQRANQGRREQR